MFWLIATLGACGDNDDLYAECATADDCEDVPEGAEAACLPKGDAGWCTWTCTTDGDCEDDLVCASFESEDATYCFPECEEDPEEEEEECPDGFTCRSTGGGSENEKVCFPEEEDSG